MKPRHVVCVAVVLFAVGLLAACKQGARQEVLIPPPSATVPEAKSMIPSPSTSPTPGASQPAPTTPQALTLAEHPCVKRPTDCAPPLTPPDPSKQQPMVITEDVSAGAKITLTGTATLVDATTITLAAGTQIQIPKDSGPIVVTYPDGRIEVHKEATLRLDGGSALLDRVGGRSMVLTTGSSIHLQAASLLISSTAQSAEMFQVVPDTSKGTPKP